MTDTFASRSTLRVGDLEYDIFRLDALDKQGISTKRLPFSLRILLEMLLRTEDGKSVRADDIRALAAWDPKAPPSTEIAFSPARVLLQDFTGVPAVVDLAAMRDAMSKMGGDPNKINPLVPAELVIDHSVQVDEFGSAKAFGINVDFEFARNRERYAFMRWGQEAFDSFKVVPPGTGIVHQVNCEYLARVIFSAKNANGRMVAYPDTVVGTDSHTPMVNGMSVLGWGVGGIEAEAALLGQPISMLIPQVVGFKLKGKLREGATATDLVLTITQILREKGVVGKFVEFFGPGLSDLALADRLTIGNMSPEYGATCGIFPIDGETIRYLRMTGRPAEQIALVEAYAKEQGLFYDPNAPDAEYTDVVELDMGTVEPSVAGPRRPQDRVGLFSVPKAFEEALPSLLPPGMKHDGPLEPVKNGKIGHGAIVIAAITSCTNTSNPSVMLAAGLLAKKAVEKGLEVKPWVKTSLAPGSQVVTSYYERSGLLSYLEQLKFHIVGYGCTTCIGNSGPLPEEISKQVEDGKLVVASVLSGNRNFEGRINPEVRANYLMSPPLVVAYALAGRIDIDFDKEPIGTGKDGQPVYLRDIWPTQAEVKQTVDGSVEAEMFSKVYAAVYDGDDRWKSLDIPKGDTFAWSEDSTYIQHPPYFVDMPKEPAEVSDIRGARVLALLGDSITTDHISPAGVIRKDSPAGEYLMAQGVQPRDFNSYGSRRGNHEVMVRGTFANVRLRNQLAPGTEGGFTRHFPSGKQMTIFEAAEQYQKENVPLIAVVGKEYGSGSSRDWAAKGARLLGMRAVLAESYERIHRSNLIGMGIIPLEFQDGESAASHGLTGEETYDILGLADLLKDGFANGRDVTVRVTAENGTTKELKARVRIDTPQEALYYQHGGILQYVLRQLLGTA